MARLIIYKDVCKGCGLCTTACPKKILTLDQNNLNQKGYYPVSISDQEKCIGCCACARMCPDLALEVEK